MADRALATVLFLALQDGAAAVPRRARPGVGKTEIAKVLAEGLGRRLIRLQCYEGLDVASAVYEWNYAGQMIEIRLAEAAGDVDRERARKRHLLGAVSGQAAACCRRWRPDAGGAPVLLIDELDRTDEAFEAFLLEVLSDFQVTVPELGTIKAERAADRRHHVEPHPRDP